MIEIKQGETFAYDIELRDEDDDPIVPDEIPTAQVRNKKNDLIADLEISHTGQGDYTISAESTTSWAVGNLWLDIRIIRNDVIYYSDDISVNIKRSWTKV